METKTIYIRCYNYPQKTDKASFYKIQQMLYSIAKRFVGKNGNVWRKFETGFDDEHGEYLSLKATKRTPEESKDLIVWLDYRR